MKTDVNFIHIHKGRGFRISRTVLMTPKFYQLLKAAKQSGKIIPEWTEDGVYSSGSYVQYEDEIFLTKKDFAKGEDFNPGDHERVRVGSVALNQKEASRYNYNDIVEKDGKLVVSTDKVDEEHPEGGWVEMQTGMVIESIISYTNDTFSGAPRKSEKMIFVNLDDVELPTPHPPKNNEGEDIPTNPVEFYKTDTIAIRRQSLDTIEGLVAVTLSGIDKNTFDANFDPEEPILVTFFTDEEDTGTATELRTDMAGPTVLSDDEYGNKQITIPFNYLLMKDGFNSEFSRSGMAVAAGGEQMGNALYLNGHSFVTIKYSLFSELPLTVDGSIQPEWIDYDGGSRLSLTPDVDKKMPGEVVSHLITADYQKKLIFQPDEEYICFYKEYFNQPQLDVPVCLLTILRDKKELITQAAEFRGTIKIYLTGKTPGEDIYPTTYWGKIDIVIKNFRTVTENSRQPPMPSILIIDAGDMSDQNIEITLTDPEGVEIPEYVLEDSVIKIPNPDFGSEGNYSGRMVCTFNGYFLGVRGYEDDKLSPFGHHGTLAEPKVPYYDNNLILEGKGMSATPPESKTYIGAMVPMLPLAPET